MINDAENDNYLFNFEKFVIIKSLFDQPMSKYLQYKSG